MPERDPTPADPLPPRDRERPSYRRRPPRRPFQGGATLLIVVLLLCAIANVVGNIARMIRTLGGSEIAEWFRTSYWPWFDSFILFVAAALAAEWWVRRWRLAHGPANCKSCGYDTTGLPSAGICPECGKPYHRPTLSSPGN